MLCYLWYLLTIRNVPADGSKGFAKFLLTNDIIRTIACGGWIYITSSDDHDIHDIAMIVYLLCTIPHVVGTIKTAPQNPKAQQYRKLFAYTFFGALIPMVYFFIQHNVHRIPGGKSSYSHDLFYPLVMPQAQVRKGREREYRMFTNSYFILFPFPLENLSIHLLCLL